MTEANETVPSANNVWPEPFPEWTEAIKKWGWMWSVHIYGFGGLFAFLTLYAFSSLYRFRKALFARRKIHLRVMCFTLMAAGFGRSLVLFWDPYTSSESSSAIQNLLVLISWGIATACMTSAFSIMLLIFLETTKTRLGPPKLRSLPLLVSITLLNIVYLTISDLVVWFYPKAKVMIFICHVAFAVWGLAISAGCSVAGFKMWRNLRSTLQAHTSGDQCSLRDVKKLKRLFIFMTAASIFGVFIFSVSLYISIGEFGVFSRDSYAKSWPWFAMQTTVRTMELLLSFLIFLIAVDNPRNCNQTLPSLPSRFTTAQNTFERIESQMEGSPAKLVLFVETQLTS